MKSKHLILILLCFSIFSCSIKKEISNIEYFDIKGKKITSVLNNKHIVILLDRQNYYCSACLKKLVKDISLIISNKHEMDLIVLVKWNNSAHLRRTITDEFKENKEVIVLFDKEENKKNSLFNYYKIKETPAVFSYNEDEKEFYSYHQIFQPNNNYLIYSSTFASFLETLKN